MDNLVTLSPVDQERLLIAIESSLHVHRRSQYYLWTQGILQSFLAHDALIFGRGEYGMPEFSWEILARSHDWEEPARLRELEQLVLRMLDGWQRAGSGPCAFVAAEDGREEIGRSLFRLGLGHALIHGTREFSGASSGFFIFLHMPEAPGRRQIYFAEILLPYLHTTLHRMLLAEKAVPAQRPIEPYRLSARELQVIGLVRDGKTNREIAEVLDLSALTIKNHVQKVLRKLSVANRAQAVAKVVQARLLDD